MSLGCDSEAVTYTKTQITLRVHVEDASLLARTSDLRIQLFRKDEAWVPTGDVVIPTTNVRWPVDVPILPKSASAAGKPFEIVVEAREAATRLAQARVITGYAVGSLRVLDIYLYACSGLENQVCAEDACRGEGCQVCNALGQCAAVMIVDPSKLPAFIPSESPSIPGGGGGMDAGSGSDDSGEADVAPGNERPSCTPACSANAECAIEAAGARCRCLAGFVDMAGACVDANECELNNGDCGANAVCSNTEGSRTCSCKPGFERAPGATECTDKCAAAGCDAHATCAIVGTAAVCTCAPPYTGTDGKSCVFDQDCAQLNCGPNSVCQVTGTTRECKCSTGFAANGTTCTNIDECTATPNICGPNSTCTDTQGAYTCGCIDGFQTSTSGCQNIDDCTASSCLNGGACKDGVKTTTCDCAGTGFEGNRCQTNTNDCTASSCMNGGQCVDGVNGVTCNCSMVDFNGDRCEIRVADCPSTNPCLNGGTCVDGNRTFTCSCRAGFTGARCETNANDCTPNPCMNGGTCSDGADTYTCSCPAGYSGTRCETNINECMPNPCLNGASCTDGINRFTCNCQTGYSGMRCETNTNDCPSPSQCLNGGICVDGLNSWSCSCTSGFSGARCEQRACGSLTISNAMQLQNARDCATVTGDLTIAGAGLSTVSSSDFPFLTRVTGNLLISNLAGGATSPELTSVVFSKLQTIGGAFKIGETLALVTATFPELTSVGSIDSGLGSLVHWNLPKLTTVNGSVSIGFMNRLCTFAAPSVRTVSGDVALSLMPKAAASQFDSLVAAARGSMARDYVGCCFLADRAGCGDQAPGDFDCSPCQ